MVSCSQVARGKPSSTFIINCIHWGEIWKTEGGTPTICLVEPLLKVRLQMLECQRTDWWHQRISSRTAISLYEHLPIKFKVVPFQMTCLLVRRKMMAIFFMAKGRKPKHSVRGEGNRGPAEPLALLKRWEKGLRRVKYYHSPQPTAYMSFVWVRDTTEQAEPQTGRESWKF